MLQRLISFGYRHHDITIPAFKAGAVVIDVRQTFRNPWHDRTLRKLNGLDPEVQRDIEKTPNFAALYAYIKEQVSVPGVEVAYIGCTGGHHRSVYLVERLGKELGVPVEHRDLSKP